MKNVNEDINELIAQFYDFKTNSRIADDIATNEKMFSSNSACEPSLSLLADIKEIIYAAGRKERERIYRLVWRYAAATAIIIAVLGGGISFLYRPAQQSQSYAFSSFWQDTLTPMETTVDAQFAQLESFEPDLPLTLDHIVSPEMNAISDITAELNDSDTTFWKG